jgi:hypothetical protein
MSMKAECPACKAYLSGVYDAMEGERPGCPNCGLPGSAIAAVEEARKSKADEKLKAEHADAIVRAGKAEAELATLRAHLEKIKAAVNDPPERAEVW